MIRAAVLLGGIISLLATAHPATAAAPAVDLKGFVISRSAQVLTVQRGGPELVRVVLTDRTVVAGERDSASAIEVYDLIRVEGSSDGEGLVQAARVEVVLTGEGVSVTSQRRGSSNFIWNWLLTGGWSVPLK